MAHLHVLGGGTVEIGQGRVLRRRPVTELGLAPVKLGGVELVGESRAMVSMVIVRAAYYPREYGEAVRRPARAWSAMYCSKAGCVSLGLKAADSASLERPAGGAVA